MILVKVSLKKNYFLQNTNYFGNDIFSLYKKKLNGNYFCLGTSDDIWELTNNN